MFKKAFYCMMAMVMVCIFSISPTMAQAKYKVLVVMSYEDTHMFEKDMRNAIDSVLGDTCEVRYFYMETKKNFKGGKQKAEEAYALYQEFQPDGVIAADDNAQSMFIVPYLKEKVKTPVIFCGVNAEAEKYGYPASNVSGILERHHLIETLAFVKLLVPSIKTIGYVMNDNPSGRANLEQIKSKADTYIIKPVIFKLVKTVREAVTLAKELQKECDLLFVANLQGITDENGEALTDKKAIPIVVKAFGKPTIGITSVQVKCGVLCAVVQTGKEQGETAAKMLLKAMQGTPVSDILITRNHNGKAMINITTMKALGIKPDYRLLHSAELIRTEE